MKNKLLNLIKSPIFAVLLFIAVYISVIASAALYHDEAAQNSSKLTISAVDSVSKVVLENFTSSRITTVTTTTTTTTTVTETTTTSLYEVCTPTVYAGTSPNSSFYQERMAVAGDSLALGFNFYGFIPDMHNIATESVSMWNLDY